MQRPNRKYVYKQPCLLLGRCVYADYSFDAWTSEKKEEKYVY